MRRPSFSHIWIATCEGFLFSFTCGGAFLLLPPYLNRHMRRLSFSFTCGGAFLLLPPYLNRHTRQTSFKLHMWRAEPLWSHATTFVLLPPYLNRDMRRPSFSLPSYLNRHMRRLSFSFTYGGAFVVACDDIFPSASVSESSHATDSFKLHMWRMWRHAITCDKTCGLLPPYLNRHMRQLPLSFICGGTSRMW